VRHAALQAVLTVVEETLVEIDRGGCAAIHLGELHGLVVDEAGMEKLELERQLLAPPPSHLRTEADVAVLVVGERGRQQMLRHAHGAHLVRLGREQLRLVLQHLEIEHLVVGARLRSEPAGEHKRHRQTLGTAQPPQEAGETRGSQGRKFHRLQEIAALLF